MNNKLGHIPVEEREPSLVPPLIAVILSVFIPGLGQMLGRAWRRGLLLLFSMLTILSITVWRFKLAAPRDTGALNIIQKAFHLEPFMVWLSVIIVLLYLWIIVDAYIVAKQSESNPLGLFFMVMVVFFGLGWQIGEVNLVAMVTQVDQAAGPLLKIAWPWERAIHYPEDVITTITYVQVPCTEEMAELAEAEASAFPPDSEAYLEVSPNCGEMSEQEGATGTVVTLSGYDLLPNTETDIWWEDPIGNEFRQRQEGEYVKFNTDDKGAFQVDIILPYRLLPPSAGEGPKIWTAQARQVGTVGEPELSVEFILTIEKMIETIFIGMMATFFGIIFALPVSFFAARNLMSASPVTLVVYYLVRAVLNIVRSIEPLIWAIIFVIMVGLGPFAGILALTAHSIAALGKLYSESIESIDPGPIEAIQATGANWVQVVVFAVIPQIVPPFVSFTIYRWDINIRMSTIIGFVGGGGIGFLLQQYIKLLDYRSAGMAVWFIAITVAILDYVSAEIRARFI